MKAGRVVGIVVAVLVAGTAGYGFGGGLRDQYPRTVGTHRDAVIQLAEDMHRKQTAIIEKMDPVLAPIMQNMADSTKKTIIISYETGVSLDDLLGVCQDTGMADDECEHRVLQALGKARSTLQ